MRLILMHCTARDIGGIIFDIDNTLVPHGAPADERAKKLFAHLKELGFSCCLLSNNKEPRVKMFNDDVQVQYILKQENQSVLVMKRQWSGWERTGATPCLSEIDLYGYLWSKPYRDPYDHGPLYPSKKKRYRLY